MRFVLDMDPERTVPLNMVYVVYEKGNPVTLVLALSSLLPIFTIVSLAVVFATTREVQALLFFVLQLLNEAINIALKHVFRERRPQGIDAREGHGVYGMPSAHSQFIAFTATYLTAYILVYRSSFARTRVVRAATIVVAHALALVCSYSRVTMRFHTDAQVWVGHAAGAVDALLLFFVVGRSQRVRAALAALERSALGRWLLVRDSSEIENWNDEVYALQRTLRRRRGTNNDNDDNSKSESNGNADDANGDNSVVVDNKRTRRATKAS